MLSSEWKQWFIIKLLVIIALATAVLFSPPYGYYQLLRIALMIIFFKLAMKEYENGRIVLTVLCGVAVLMFQPLFKVAFNKYQWQIIDEGLIALMIIWCAFDFRNYRIGNY